MPSHTLILFLSSGVSDLLKSTQMSPLLFSGSHSFQINTLYFISAVQQGCEFNW